MLHVCEAVQADNAGVPVLIPAYMPGAEILVLVKSLLQLGVPSIVVVDDGSGPQFQERFRELASLDRVHVIRHAVNLGKGTALKAGLNHILVHTPACIGAVTADADGQHHPEDIVRVAARLRQNPEALIIGARQFGPHVPWRSRIGNRTSRILMGLATGRKLSDTQTGLRGIPASLIPHLLRLPASGYEFELDMLLACKYQHCAIIEEPIRTIYLDDNRSSHFDPVLDSMRIYLLLFRFSIVSFLTAVLDNVILAATHLSGGSIAQSQITARTVAMVFNYFGARSVVFHSRQGHPVVLPKYLLLVLCSGVLSYILIQFLHFRIGMSVLASKVLAEGVLFIANFAIQRDFVFTRREPDSPRATDWDRYYASVPPTARITRRYTTSVLLDAVRRHASAGRGDGQLAIVEIGGANSCFLDAMLSRIPCRSYDVVDTNEYGIGLLSGRAGDGKVVRLHRHNILDDPIPMAADLVFSVGLVEHFRPSETRAAVLAHFDYLRAGGTAIITFPTPTHLYRITRGFIEALGMWKFPDERPLKPQEVMDAVRVRGEVIGEKMLWPLLLTQYMIVARKRCAPDVELTAAVRDGVTTARSSQVSAYRRTEIPDPR